MCIPHKIHYNLSPCMIYVPPTGKTRYIVLRRRPTTSATSPLLRASPWQHVDPHYRDGNRSSDQLVTIKRKKAIGCVVGGEGGALIPKPIGLTCTPTTGDGISSTSHIPKQALLVYCGDGNLTSHDYKRRQV